MPAPRSITAISAVPSAGAGLHGDGAARRAGLRGVEHQVVEDALQQLGVEGERRNLGRVVLVDGDAGRLALDQRHGAIQRLRQVGLCERSCERAGELQEAGDQRVGAVHFARR